MIKLENLTVVFGDTDNRVVAVDGISLNVIAGESFGLVGESGSGKSTLMHIVGALDVPTSGTYTINGKSIEKMNEDPEPTDEQLNKMLKELHVKSEAEFKDKILEDWNTAICPLCLKEVKLTKAVFVNDFPYHKWCAEERGDYDY